MHVSITTAIEGFVVDVRHPDNSVGVPTPSETHVFTNIADLTAFLGTLFPAVAS